MTIFGPANYWKEIIQREDPSAMERELHVLIQHVGLRRLYELAIMDKEGTIQELINFTAAHNESLKGNIYALMDTDLLDWSNTLLSKILSTHGQGSSDLIKRAESREDLD